ncbi:MAG TPA: TIG domain-containing protein [Pyrinomonadaceae bacterium]|nr:TIG domain-containing protein [Pyrinomonadaceae bacterium]
MGLFEGKTPAERNKTIVALVLPLVALVLLLRMFFGGDSRPATRPKPPPPRPGVSGTGPNGPAEVEDPTLAMPNPLPPVIPAAYSGPDAARNIFAFPPVVVRPVATPVVSVEPTPTPPPPPPLTVNTVSPVNVFARTGDFALEVSGEKFTPESRVFLDGQELQTTFRGPQQLSAQVPSALIGAQGARTVAVRTPDGSLYSNTATINVMAPPTPQVTFIGLFGDKRYARDRAVLKPNQSNDLITVQRGELVSGRFKVINISERAVEFEDTQLKIKHTVPFSEARAANAPSGPAGRVPPQPQPPAGGDDDEP